MAADDTYELAAAQLARKMGRREEVRHFASQMIQDHVVLSRELAGALKGTGGVTAVERMTADQQQRLAGLRAAGDDFDDEYAKQEIAGHERELAALRDYADNGMDPALTEFAANAAEMAADHLRLARKL
jgi:putative membrane protein